MNIKQEIKLYAKDEQVELLNWLFSKYHYQSQWNFVDRCKLVGKYPNTVRVWTPTIEGVILYNNRSSFEE